MNRNVRFFPSLARLVLCCAAAVTSLSLTAAQPSEKEKPLLEVLKSGTPADKAITCKKLAVYGSPQAVPYLAPLLDDEQLTSWARIALEAIPGPEADKALRDAAARVQGRTLVGVLNSIGVRRDAKATEALTKLLANSDTDVAAAAADALGRIGGDKAARALEKALANGPTPVRNFAAQGCIRCAERFLTDGKTTKARKLYDKIRTAEVPKQRILEATRGAILARGDEGIPMLLEQLRSADKDMIATGMRTARELPGSQATLALAKEIFQAEPKRRPMLLLALADRNDPAAMPTIIEASRLGSKRLRIVGFGILEHVGDISIIPVLLDAAIESDQELAQAAKGALGRLQANGADAELERRLVKASGSKREVLIDIAAQRRIDGALPEIVASLKDADAGVRRAAVAAVGIMGEQEQLENLVSMVQSARTGKDRDDVEAALLAVSSRVGAKSVPALKKLADSEDSAVRIVGIHAVASAGGAEALTVANQLVQDRDDVVQDEAVRTLSSWPNTWPEDDGIAKPLLDIGKSARKSLHQVLALRGYLQYVQGEKKLKPEEKIAKLTEVLPLLRRPEDKKFAISVANASPAPGMLAILSQFAADPAITEDACSAILNAAGKEQPGITKEERQKALQTVLDKCGNDNLKKKAAEALKTI